MVISKQFSRDLGKKMEPMIGIEPMTYSLRVNCSTDWATLAFVIQLIYSINPIFARKLSKKLQKRRNRIKFSKKYSSFSGGEGGKFFFWFAKIVLAFLLSLWYNILRCYASCITGFFSNRYVSANAMETGQLNFVFATSPGEMYRQDNGVFLSCRACLCVDL